MFRLTAKAESASNAIMWILTLLIGIICFLWMFQSVDPAHVSTIDVIEADLENIQVKLSRACGSMEYSGPFNPLMLHGNLSVIGSEVCIEAANLVSCRTITCDTGMDLFFDISTVEELTIIKDETTSTFTIT